MESKSVFFYIFGLILLCIKTKYSKKRPFHDTCNSTIYNYWLHMKWTSNVVNPRVVVLLRVVAWRNTTSRGLKTGCWPYMNMNMFTKILSSFVHIYAGQSVICFYKNVHERYYCVLYINMANNLFFSIVW